MNDQDVFLNKFLLFDALHQRHKTSEVCIWADQGKSTVSPILHCHAMMLQTSTTRIDCDFEEMGQETFLAVLRTLDATNFGKIGGLGSQRTEKTTGQSSCNSCTFSGVLNTFTPLISSLIMEWILSFGLISPQTGKLAATARINFLIDGGQSKMDSQVSFIQFKKGMTQG